MKFGIVYLIKREYFEHLIMTIQIRKKDWMVIITYYSEYIFI